MDISSDENTRDTDKNSSMIFPLDSEPYNLSYIEWTVKWWQWFLLTPKSINPAVDGTGEYSYMNQPYKHVWFLAGKLVNYPVSK